MTPGLRCEGCGATTSPTPQAPWPFRCPAQIDGDDIDHVLVSAIDPSSLTMPERLGPEDNPFVVWRRMSLAHSVFMAHGPGRPDERDQAFVSLVETLDRSVVAVDGVGFRVTPLSHEPALAEAVGVANLWVKNETGNVSGSHKARHLMGLAIYIAVVEAIGWVETVPELAIASCGNAALAAAVVAKAARRPLRVFIPVDASVQVVERLEALEARIEICERREGEVGDPCYLRFIEAVAGGALPFCCQGPAAGLTLEGSQTLGYEIAARLQDLTVDHLFVQVGGGALGSGIVRGLEAAVAADLVAQHPRFHTVQTTGAAPLDRAWARARQLGESVDETMADVRSRRAHFMWPWETTPKSIAHGILDDETYDWARLVQGMLAHDGRAVVAGEGALYSARELASKVAGIQASYTGAAGLAGLLELLRDGVVDSHESVLVVLTGVNR